MGELIPEIHTDFSLALVGEELGLQELSPESVSNYGLHRIETR